MRNLRWFQGPQCHSRKSGNPSSIMQSFFLFCFFTVGIGLPHASADMANAIGVACAVKGHVEATSTDGGARILQSGMPIYVGDQVTTDEKGHVQILLRDETTFTLGPESAMKMEEFVYDPNQETGKIVADVVKGVFRFISGKIARKDPEDMKVNLPVGNIGIRGTMVAGKVEGTRSQVVLLGPGSEKNTEDKKGRIEISNQVNDKTSKVKVERTGFGTVIEGPNEGPKSPSLVSENEIIALTSVLQPSWKAEESESPEPQKGESSASEEAGQDTFNDLGGSDDVEGAVDELSDSDDQIISAVQNSTQIGRVMDGISTFDDLRRIEAGQFNFFKDGTPLAPDGDYNIHFDIDFGSRTVGGGNSHIGGDATTLAGNNSFRYSLASRSFASGSGAATFSYSGISDTNGASDGAASVTVTLNNSGGIVASNANHSISIAGTHTGSGTAPRIAGPATND